MSDGNVETARRYVPWSSKWRSAGPSVASSIDGVRPSITIRTTGFVARRSVTGKDAQARVLIGGAAARSQPDGRKEDSLQVPGDRDEREPGGDKRAEEHEHGKAEASPTASQRTGHERRDTERTGNAADGTGHGLGPVEDAEADRRAGDRRYDSCKRPAKEDPRRRDAESSAETGEHANPVPASHRIECTPGKSATPTGLAFKARW